MSFTKSMLAFIMIFHTPMDPFLLCHRHSTLSVDLSLMIFQFRVAVFFFKELSNVGFGSLKEIKYFLCSLKLMCFTFLFVWIFRFSFLVAMWIFKLKKCQKSVLNRKDSKIYVCWGAGDDNNKRRFRVCALFWILC